MQTFEQRDTYYLETHNMRGVTLFETRSDIPSTWSLRTMFYNQNLI